VATYCGRVAPPETLLDHGPEEVRRWATASYGWGTREGRMPPAVREYQGVWVRRQPMRTGLAYAQLGGWQWGWGIDSNAYMAERELILRTCRGGQPYIEVLRVRESGALEVWARVT
jgi:hypothetical protein